MLQQVASRLFRRKQWLLLLWLLLLNPCFSLSVFADPSSNHQRATEILRQVDDLWRGDSSHAVVTMRVKTEHYTPALTHKPVRAS